MSILQTNLKEIKCFKIDNYRKIIKTSLQDIDNSDNDSTVLVEMNFFGINQVYSLMNINKIKKFVSKIKDIRDIGNMLSLSRVIEDSPIEEGINLKTRSIYLNELNHIDWISIYQLNIILEGMNCISDLDIQYDLQIGKYLDLPTINLSKLDFSPDEDINYKYIFRFNDNSCRFSNELSEYSIDNENLIGIFIYLKEFNCWQYLSKKRFKTLNYPNSIEIKYAITDSPRCFSKIGYHNLYSISDFYNLLLYSIYLPVDIYFKKEFEDLQYKISNKIYDALEISVSFENYTTTVLLTHDELGIDNITQNTGILCMDKFWLLKLINNIICLKPY